MTCIRNGLIVDGTGRPAFVGDVFVEKDRIVDIGEADSVSNDAAEEIIDATGCIVSPGFIDCHSHSDAYLILEPSAASKISQGITTEINGQCGGSIAPRYGEARLSSDWASLLGDQLTWHSLAEYRAVLERARPAINTVQFVGHNTLRSSVVGYEGRGATSDELLQMGRLLEASLDEGGWGFSTGLIYQPGKYSTPDEVVTLTRIAAKCGGYYATHMRSEGDQILEAIDEVIALAKETGIRAEISHLKTSGKENWNKIDRVLEKIDAAVQEGALLGSDRYPYCAAGTDLDVVLPDWAGEGAAVGEMKRLADSTLRARIVEEINGSGRDWTSVMIGGTWSDATKGFSGKTIAELVKSESLTPGELICQILEKDLCRTGAFFFGMSEANLDKIYSAPWILPGSDASLRAPWGPLGKDHPHPRAYGTMPEFYRRVRALGFSREETIARMTSIPANRFGIRQRGRIEKGFFADLAVWREKDFHATATFENPHLFCEGVECVMVNGKVGWSKGGPTDEAGGRFLER